MKGIQIRSDETRLAGKDNLRIHENTGEVHVHDNAKGLKFSMKVKKFKTEYAAVKKSLTHPKPKVFEHKIEDANGTRLIAIRDGDDVAWSLEADLVPVTGFDEVDGFLSNF